MASLPLTRPLRSLPVMLALLAPAFADAQWSGDPADNLVIADAAGGETQPEIVAAPDGGYYVAWFDNIASGFDVHLQRLDAQGNELWPHGGVPIADRGYSSTYDYGIATDADGNAYVAFACCANSADDEHIAVSKVAPDGSLLWGAGGATVSGPGSSEAVYNAYVAVLDDGNVAVAWSAGGGVRVQKLDGDGQALWADGGIELSQPSGAKLVGGVQPGGSGTAIVSWANITGSAHTLRAQKLASADGATLWGSDAAGVQVFASGWLQFGYYPPFVADGAGGAVFHDYDQAGVSFVARVQHLDATGTTLFGADGVLATIDTTMDHTDTAVAWDAASGDIYAVWRDNYNDGAGHDFDGVSAQRIDASGTRLWGDNGKVLLAPADSTNCANAISQPTALPASDGMVAGWTTGCTPTLDQPTTVMRLDADGNAVWASQSVVIKTLRQTGRTRAVVGIGGDAVYVWQDGDDGAGESTIRAQNVQPDGTLGAGVDDVIFADGFEG